MYKWHLWVLLGAGGLLLQSCNSHSRRNDDNNTPPPATGAPVETSPPNTSYQPAFPGQTRIGSVTTQTAYEGKLLNSALSRPWGITTLPDGRLLITEKSGTMRIATTQGQLGPSITGIPAVDDRGQGGLLGLTVDPQFTANRMVYWVFSEPVQEGNLTAVAKGRLSDNEQQIENATVIYRAGPAYNGTMHYGGRIVVDGTGNLIISTGERSDLATRPQAQDPASGLGKIIRITKEGQPAPGNPTISQQRPEFYSLGHRNPQGLALHPTTGDLWESEMGPRGGDEINRIQPGKNYGWPTIGYGLEYSGQKVGEGITQKEGLEQPVYYWDPVLSPSGMTFYNSDGIAEWNNNLFITGLSSKHIARLVIRDNKVVGEERLLAGENQRFRDITQGKDGALYTVTDEGRLYRIGKK
ncbi:Glucose/arabinose dehydrogenase, beta-propeller fold [Cnuella takakiae]|uniref:Glucose/arabinose dehydrogenase, beta-propeller fold n=1 Tax=Cnuella takakiae TaxID=1302690 RepID=A0A1M5GIB7_9BACT|nr:glucose dehydrogenase [Cnuella takakiae]SHG03443.1 Glucose/arabinose dehydrogenase, beta-propeller fold [Cnuella takakiae]